MTHFTLVSHNVPGRVETFAITDAGSQCTITEYDIDEELSFGLFIRLVGDMMNNTEMNTRSMPLRELVQSPTRITYKYYNLFFSLSVN